MARAINTDPFMSCNFALQEELTVDASLVRPLTPLFTTIDVARRDGLIGFKSVSMPEVTIEYKEINEGNWPFAHKVNMGRATTGDVTISQAVYGASTDFYRWILTAMWGKLAPRRNLLIRHLYADKRYPSLGRLNRTVRLAGCMPVSWKPGSDFDADAAEVSLEELTFNVHRIEVLVSPI